MAKRDSNFNNWVMPLLFFTMVATVFLAFGVFHTIIAVRKIAIKQKNNDLQKIVNVSYKCDQDKTIEAIYLNGKVELNLSDGRSLLLIQGMSGSGVRYTNSDESLTFWNKGNTAFLEEGTSDKVTYENCVESSN